MRLFKNKIVISSLILSLLAELFLVFIIYLNPYKIAPVYDTALQMSVSGVLNFCSAFFLLLAFKAIKKRRINIHKQY
jgi:uncharacterized membrane protein YozB (DUF420 family)